MSRSYAIIKCNACRQATYHHIDKSLSGIRRLIGFGLTFGLSETINATYYQCIRCGTVTRHKSYLEKLMEDNFS